MYESPTVVQNLKIGIKEMTDYVIAFLVMVFFLTIYFAEDERTDQAYIEWVERANERHNGLTDQENWELQDSLWELIRYEGELFDVQEGDSIMVKKK